MVKILLISRDYPPVSGGVSDYTYHIAHALAEKGCDVSVLTSAGRGIDRAAENQVAVLPVVRTWGSGGIPSILNEIHRIRPDRVILQYVPNMYSHYAMPLYIALLAIILRIKGHLQIVCFHEIAYRFYFSKPKYWAVSIIQRIIAYIILIASNNAVTSNAYYRSLFRPFQSRIAVIPVGSNILPVDISMAEMERLIKKTSPHGEFIITTFGTNPHQRRNDIMLRAVSEYNRQTCNHQLKVIFIGNIGEESRNGLISLSKESGMGHSVIFTGQLAPRDVYLYLAISDLFFIFDVWEKSGAGGISSKSGSAAAAYAAGLPLLSCKGDLTDPLFKHGENVFFVDDVSERTVLTAIRKLVHNRQLLKIMGENAIKTYETHLKWPAIADRFMGIIRKEEDVRRPDKGLSADIANKSACR